MFPLLTHNGHLIRLLHCCTDQTMTNALAAMDLTAAQGHILGFIAHRSQAPCSRDIEKAFHLTHPTVSGLLARLEKKGFIEFRPDSSDRRCKRIYILPKGNACNETMYQTILNNEQQLVSGFSDEEKEQFSRLLTRAIHNMGVTPCKHEEENDKC